MSFSLVSGSGEEMAGDEGGWLVIDLPTIQAHLCHQQLGDHGRVLFLFAPPVSHLSRKITITGAVPRIKWRDGYKKC